MKVYLAGPISGLTYGQCTDWREKVKDTVDPGIVGLSPMRGKQYLEERSSKDGMITGSYEEWPLSSSRGINTRDHWDVSRCDVVFVNLLGATTVSIGTVMEIAWAHAYRKPVVLVMEESGNPHEHCMIRECVGFRVKTLEEGIDVLNALNHDDVSILTAH